MKKSSIFLKNVNVHNLKGVDLELPSNELIVFTGVSGSGKSSLAFDTIYVEGQRRYIESLSTFARRYLGDISKPDVEFVSGLSPTISIEQKTAGKNPRSTVGTMTEIFDYLRVLFARIGIAHCPVSGEPVTGQSKERIISKIQKYPPETKIYILSPFAKGKKGEFKEDFAHFLRRGFTRARVDGSMIELSDEIALDKNLTHDIDLLIDRLTIREENYSRIAEAVIAALEIGNGMLTVFNPETNEETLFSTHAYSQKSGLYYSSLEPHDFSFNSPSGMCPECQGLGQTTEFDLDLIIDSDKSISEDCCSIASSYSTVRFKNIHDNLAKIYGFNVKTPWKKLSENAKKIFLYGTEKKWTQMHFVHPVKGSSWTEYVNWRGVVHEAKLRLSEAKSDLYREKMKTLMVEQLCPVCKGSRLKAYPAATIVGGKKIHKIAGLTISQCFHFFNDLLLDETEKKIAEELLKEIISRLKFLIDVGLHYLTLDRTSPTLSGGESQRVRLASQVGSGLVGVTYVLDEPSIGLHPRDNTRLIDSLKKLRDVGNSVIVVEHDEETILAADRIVDFGPGPGKNGGKILVNGSIKELVTCKDSLTGAYLSGRKQIAIPDSRRKPLSQSIEIKGASHHNLKNIDVKFPLGIFIAITGVSGSGKSSLITDTLFPSLANHLHHAQHKVGKLREIIGLEGIDKVIAIDQSPIGRNPRSNPATYIKIFDEIRQLFSTLPESVARGYPPGRFSFNVKDGSCPQCKGAGMIRIDMDFMEDAYVVCSSCKNRRFDHETLSIHYKGKNIHDVLEMTVEESLKFFEAIPSLKRKLEVIAQVGMEYMTLGQPSTTLSGGEAQRIKLAKELIRPSSGKTFYILDEPTTGLHFHDIQALLKVLHELVERGNTVLVIEHNMDVIKTADWIIDIGPEGGEKGGEIVGVGTPEHVAKMKTPTGIFLKQALKQTPVSLSYISPEPKYTAGEIQNISVNGAEQNNLKYLSLSIPRKKISICSGPSGSGKSSLAFETIYAEGQRRYIESLSPYARQFVKQMPKPKVGQIEGLSPAIAIEQKSAAGNPRSTVGTMTEVYDYLRVLFARLGTAYDPETQEEIKSMTKESVVKQVLSYPDQEKIYVLAPLALEKNEKFEDIIARFQRQGFLRIYLNGQFFELDQEIAFDRKRKNQLSLVVDRLKLGKESSSRLYEAVENALRFTDHKVSVLRESGQEILFNLAFAVQSTGKSFPEITPHTFSFNSHEGMCPDCMGLGFQYGANFTQNEEIMDLSFEGLLEKLWIETPLKFLKPFLKKEKIDPHLSLRELQPSQLQFILNGSTEDQFLPYEKGIEFRWLGLQPILAKAGRVAHAEIRAPLIPLLDEIECHSCNGTRLNALARNVRIEGHSIASLCKLPIANAFNFIEMIEIPNKLQKLLEETCKQLKSRLKFLMEVGLHYLSLDRRAPTLSNGESQRIRLARQLGSQLTGILYVLDEPTIGLHPHDNSRLNQALLKLKNLGNTLLLVEHDPLTLEIADYLFDFGPSAGVHGGHLMAHGTLKELKNNPDSLTGTYLSGRVEIPTPEKKRAGKGMWTLKSGTPNNLKDFQFSLPIGVLTCLTGVSGSGKSTLMHEVIRPQAEKEVLSQTIFNKVIVIDQNPIGHTARSDVGTYVELLQVIREFYAALPVARTHGLAPKNFSYNHRKGMCGSCFGMGYKKVEMQFLPPVKIICDQCNGMRLNPLSLEVIYQNKNFGQLLETTVEEAKILFDALPKAKRILDTLISVGLGYLKLGQEMASLSGGEAQRMKLSRELSKRGTGKTLYLLDEPTTGLHPHDILKLLEVLHKLVDKGNTMVLIEHNMDVIKNCDHLIDLGPEAGEDGGRLLYCGEVDQIPATTLTGSYLIHYLKKRKQSAKKLAVENLK